MLIIAEGATDMITDIEIYYKMEEDGFTEIHFEATSGTITIEIYRIAL